MPRHQFIPTDADRQTVQALARCGIPQEQIALFVVNPSTSKPLDPKTLRLHFREELDNAAALANARVANNLFQIATSDKPGSVAACIFWQKTRAGWRETIYHGAIDPEPIDVDRIRNEIMRGLIPSTTDSETA